MSESRCLGREVPVFSEKEVSICSERRKQVEKMHYFFFFGISLYVFPHYIYCNCSEEEKRRISFWLPSGNEHAEKDKREASGLNTVLFVLFFLEEPLLCIETGT